MVWVNRAGQGVVSTFLVVQAALLLPHDLDILIIHSQSGANFIIGQIPDFLEHLLSFLKLSAQRGVEYIVLDVHLRDTRFLGVGFLLRLLLGLVVAHRNFDFRICSNLLRFNMGKRRLSTNKI